MPGKAAIITRTKNRPNFLRRAMRSVLGQTHRDWVHVVVNDGGKRSEIDLLAIEFEDAYEGRLQILHLPESIGMQSASNAGIEASESDYIVIHDDDDSLHPRYLEKTIGFLSGSEPDSYYQGVISQTWRIDEDINAYGEIHETGRSHYMPLDFVEIFRFGSENPFPPIAFLYRRHVHKEIGLFNQRYNVLGDWDFHYRFIQKFEIGVLPEKLANYHWRVGTQAAGFSNTVTTGVAEHFLQQNKLQNDYIRRHIQDSPEIIAPLMSLGRDLHQAKNQLDYANQQIASIQQEVRGMRRELLAAQKQPRGLLSFNTKNSGQAPLPPQPISHKHPDPVLFDRAKYLKTARRRKLISFDIFDTCLLRTTQRPIDVFLIVESLTDITVQGEAVPFARARELAEQRARRLTPHGEITFEDIYKQLAKILPIAPKEVEALYQLECQVERQTLYPNRIIQELYQELKDAGKRIIFISDMYFPKETLRELLLKNGFEADEIYVSCEYQKSKHHGDLYDLVLEKEGVQGAEVLHFGDNYRSDIEQAQQRGLKIGHFHSAYLPQTYFANSPHPQRYTGARDLTSCAIGLAQKNRITLDPKADTYWTTFGYEIAGPLYFFYVKWLIEQTRESGRKQLVFLARDGYYLKRAFELMDASWKTGLKSQYLFASRRLFNIAAMTGLDDDALAFLTTPNPNMRVKDFLARLDFDPNQYKRQIKQAGLKSLDEAIATPIGTFIDESARHKIYALMRLLSVEIISKSHTERALLFDYFDSIPLDPKQSVFVDVGWQASSIKSLSRLFTLRNDAPTNLTGCFFGTWHFAQPTVDAGNDIRSFFHHLNEPKSRSDLIHESVSIIESLFAAPHPTIIGIKKEASGWMPTYADTREQSKSNHRLELTWEGAERFIKDMLPLSSPTSADDGLELLQILLDRILRYPTQEDALALGNIEHRESYGSNRSSTIVNPPPHSSDKNKLQHGLDQSNWKKGYLARLSQKQITTLYKQT